MVDLLGGGIVLRNHDGASAASSLCATKLGAREADPSQVFEKGDLRVDVAVVEHDACAVKVETEGAFVGGGDGRESIRRLGPLGGDGTRCHDVQ